MKAIQADFIDEGRINALLSQAGRLLKHRQKRLLPGLGRLKA